MAIYALFGSLSARSGLAAPFSTHWSKIDSLSWGIYREMTVAAGTGASAGVANIREIQLAKRMDGLSALLTKQVLTGSALPSVNIAFTEGAGVKTVMAFKLSNVFVATAQFAGDAGGAANEVITLLFKQIAMAVLTAGTMDIVSWDVAAATAWNMPATTFTLDPTTGIKIA